MCFSHLDVFLISVKPLTTENTENKTTPKICKITVAGNFRQRKISSKATVGQFIRNLFRQTSVVARLLFGRLVL